MLSIFLFSFLAKSEEIYPSDFAGLKYYDAAIKYGKCMEQIYHPTKDTKKGDIEKCQSFVGSYEANIALNYTEKFERVTQPLLKQMSGVDVINKEKEIFKEMKELVNKN